MTVNEAIYSVRKGIKQYTDDTSITNRSILFEIDLGRAEYYDALTNSNRLKNVPEQAKQTICLTLEEISNAQCGCTTTDCTILRSVKEVPKVLGSKPRISSAEFDSVSFNSVSWDRFIYSGHSKYNKDSVFASLRSDDYVYIKSKNPLHKVMNCIYLTGLFAQPDDASEFQNENGTNCYDKSTSEYPMDMSGFSKVREMVIKKFLRELRVPEDVINNAHDDTQGEARGKN